MHGAIIAMLFLTLLLMCVTAYYSKTTPYQEAKTADAAQTADVMVAGTDTIGTLAWPRRDRAPEMLGGVDLFAYIGFNSDWRQTLYNLSNFDRRVYKNIFIAQAKGDWRQANALIKRVQNPVLMGHVLYDRYIGSSEYKATYQELREWMVQYGDHPNAYRVYQLAQKRRHNSPDALPAPQMAKKFFGSLELSWLVKETNQQPIARKPANRNENDVRQLMGTIKKALAKDRVTTAYNHLKNSPTVSMLTAVEYDSLLAEISSQYYYNGKFDQASELAHQAIKRSGKSVPIAYWVAGLTAWRQQDYTQAARHFEVVPQTISRNPWMLSAGAFWAARAYEKTGNTKQAHVWLQEASAYPRTFYGLIAKTKLGDDDEAFSWSAPKLNTALLDALRNEESGKRALALIDIGRSDLAQKEMLQIHPKGNKHLEKALIAASHHFNLPEMAWRLGNTINQPDGTLYDVALYPMVPWKGDTSTGIDPALTNALIRQESRFDPQANSSAGARGLMQLMPRTAQFVSDSSFDAKNINDPDVNIALGQRYIRYLLKMPQINGNLLYLAAAYNAGPGNLTRWQKTHDFKNDPYLFIESIPLSETRAFVERVMTNYWVYNQRLGQDTETLEQLTKDQWPSYRIPTDKTMQMALAETF